MAARKNGRDKRATQPDTDDDRSGLKRVKLSPETIKVRGEEMASEQIKLEGVEEKKAAAVGKFNKEIKLHKQRLHVLAQEVDTGYAFVEAQTDLDFEGADGRRHGAAAAKARELAGQDDGSDDDDSDDDDVGDEGVEHGVA